MASEGVSKGMRLERHWKALGVNSVDSSGWWGLENAGVKHLE